MTTKNPDTIKCINCESDIARSKAIIMMSDEFPQLIEENKTDSNTEVKLCYECLQKLRD